MSEITKEEKKEVKTTESTKEEAKTVKEQESFTGKTKSGFSYEIDPENLNDYELFECLSEVQKKPILVPLTIRKLLGSEQTERLKDHLRDEKGRVPNEKMLEAIEDIFEQTTEVKN